jgi:hypothetical protein
MPHKPDGSREWEAYAKDRYESRRGALVEFRGWARQFMQFVGVVIAIEIALFGKLVDVFSPWSALPILSLVGTVAYQLTLLDLARGIGYSLAPFQYPAAPDELAIRRSERAMRREISMQYVMAYEERDAESAEVGPRIAGLSRGFTGSLYGLIASLLLTFVMLSLRIYLGPR